MGGMSNRPKEVYTIVEREGGGNWWVRVGVAWVNRDGSLNVTLNALPVNGKLHIRDPDERRPASQPPPPPEEEFLL